MFYNHKVISSSQLDFLDQTLQSCSHIIGTQKGLSFSRVAQNKSLSGAIVTSLEIINKVIVKIEEDLQLRYHCIDLN